jgi:hypothetical protein
VILIPVGLALVMRFISYARLRLLVGLAVVWPLVGCFLVEVYSIGFHFIRVQ